MQLRYAVYARKSTEDEGRQILSLESQLDEARLFAEREVLQVVDEITESYSAWEPFQRVHFERLVKEIERGRVDGLIAWHPDRLSRNETDGATIIRLLRQGKLRDLRFVSYTFTNTPEGIMMLQMALSQSQYQNAKLSVDVQRGMKKKRDLGWFPHQAPEGYLNDKKQISPDPERFSMIRKGWDLLISGQCSAIQAIDAINDLGYRTRIRDKVGGGPLSRSAGYRIFTNPFYTGRFICRGILYQGSHVPMVTEEEFGRVQEAFRRTGRMRRLASGLPYGGLIRCARCGWGVTTELQRGAHQSGEYRYLRCSNPRCERQAVRMERFEELVTSFLERLSINNDIAGIVIRELQHATKEALPKRQQTRVGETNETSVVQAKLSRLLDLLLVF